MESIHAPEISDAEFNDIPPSIFQAVLSRTIEFGFFEFFQGMHEERHVLLQDLDYKQAMEAIIQAMLVDNWFIVSKEPADNSIPVFVFQRDVTNILVSGARNGKVSGITAIVTAASKNELAAGKKVSAKILGKFKVSGDRRAPGPHR
jgi:hypothetical protein